MKLHLKLSNTNPMYYSPNKALSYNPFLVIGLGTRGPGKTTGWILQGLKNFNNRNEEFIYLRRYKTEIKNFVNKNSMAPMCDGIIYKGDGAGGYTMVHEDTTVGYCIPLSTARSYKSVDFSNVTLIFYDEAIVARGTKYQYLPNEVPMLLEFISTVVRTRNNVTVAVMGNNEDMFNPFCSYFNIPLFQGEYYFDKQRGILVEMIKKTEALKQRQETTKFHSLIKNTLYGDYHDENDLLTKIDGNIIEKPNNCSLYCRVIINKETLTFYIYMQGNESYIYCEHKDKLMIDKYAYVLMDSKGINYYYGNQFKDNCKKFIDKIYYLDKMNFNNKRAINMFGWLLKEI